MHVFGVGHDPGDLSQGGFALEFGVGSEHDRRDAQPTQRGDHGEGARPGLHQDSDTVALSDADTDQALHHAVDARLHVGLAMRTVLEKERRAHRRLSGLLVE